MKITSPVFASIVKENFYSKSRKLAKVTLPFKNGAENSWDNYRPIYVMPSLSKPLKKHVVEFFANYNHNHNYKLSAI